MIKTRIGFLIFGQHKDGTHTHVGGPHMDYLLFDKCKDAVRSYGIELVCEEVLNPDLIKGPMHNQPSYCTATNCIFHCT